MLKAILKKIVTSILLGVVTGIFLIISTYNIVASYNNLKTTLTTVYGVLPVLVIDDTEGYFLDTKPDEVSAQAGSMGPVVAIYAKDTYADSLAHELTHVKQFYRYGLFFSTPLYFNSQKHRVKFEYEAYMSENTKLSKEEFIEYMRSYYNISLTNKEIYSIIKE